MKDVLYNLALIDTIQYCENNSIDCSGSHLERIAKRGFWYTLYRTDSGEPIVTVQFTRDSIPIHYV